MGLESDKCCEVRLPSLKAIAYCRNFFFVFYFWRR